MIEKIILWSYLAIIAIYWRKSAQIVLNKIHRSEPHTSIDKTDQVMASIGGLLLAATWPLQLMFFILTKILFGKFKTDIELREEKERRKREQENLLKEAENLGLPVKFTGVGNSSNVKVKSIGAEKGNYYEILEYVDIDDDVTGIDPAGLQAYREIYERAHQELEQKLRNDRRSQGK